MWHPNFYWIQAGNVVLYIKTIVNICIYLSEKFVQPPRNNFCKNDYNLKATENTKNYIHRIVAEICHFIRRLKEIRRHNSFHWSSLPLILHRNAKLRLLQWRLFSKSEPLTTRVCRFSQNIAASFWPLAVANYC